MMNKIGPRTEPCGTLWQTGAGEDWAVPRTTQWYVPDRYDLNHSWAVPVMPRSLSRRSRRILLHTVSKAAERSQKINRVRLPESAAKKTSLMTLTRAVSVLCLSRNPDYIGSYNSW